MIFSDEPRFRKSAVPHPTNSQIHGFVKSETESHVGPGSYFANGHEDKRNGWKSKSFSVRQPMSPVKASSPSQADRQEYFTAGYLTSYGTMAAPVSPSKRNNPGPGHYDGDVFTSFSASPIKRVQSADSLASIRASPKMGTTPRFNNATSLCIKDGVLFQSKENSQPTCGPGHYPVARHDFLKKSHNVRVNKQSSSPKPVVDVRQTFGTPGSTFKTPDKYRRPMSASPKAMNGVRGQLFTE